MQTGAGIFSFSNEEIFSIAALR